jgi:hypothetical protein
VFENKSNKMAFYLGGYYLIHPKPITFGSQVSKIVYTCSNCINGNLLDHWSYSFTTNNDGNIEHIKSAYGLTSEDVFSIRDWADAAVGEKSVGWINLFKDIHTIREYRQKFFIHLPDTNIISIYFDESEADDLLEQFKPREQNFGELGLYENLIKKIPDVESKTETLIGFDIIGIELDGGFHSFHCHDLSDDLAERFNLEINEYGLFTAIANSKAVVEFMNDPENGFEPVPWFVCKSKLVSD